MRGITALDIAIIVVYLAGTTLLGIWVGRKQKDAKDYFVADRSIPWWAAGISVMATQLSAITMIGTTGQGYTDGLRFIHQTKTGRDAVPGIDDGNRQRELHQLRIGELPAYVREGGVRCMAFGHRGQRLGPGERGPFAIAVERRPAPHRATPAGPATSTSKQSASSPLARASRPDGPLPN